MPRLRRTTVAPALVGATLLALALLMASQDEGARSQESLPSGKAEFLQKEQAALERDLRSTQIPFDPDDPSTWPEWFDTSTPTVDWGRPMGDGAYYDSPSNLRHYSKIYRVVDRWVGRVPDASVVINAGWLTEDPKQGVVYVVAYDPVTSNPTYDIRNGAHLTPVKTGGLRVVGADGTLVKLLSEDGVEWVFNATEGRFVSPHEEPLPTASPVPTPRPTPVILPVERVSIDARIDGNSVTTWGSVEGCAEVAIGASATVDLVVEGLPAVGGSAMGITGFDLKLGYDPALLRVAALDVNQLLGVRPNSFPSSLGDPLPDADGSFRVTVVDFGPNSGDPATISEATGGILVRVTFAAVAAGVSDLTLNDTGIIDTRNDAHRVAEEVGARIAVGLPCP